MKAPEPTTKVEPTGYDTPQGDAHQLQPRTDPKPSKLLPETLPDKARPRGRWSKHTIIVRQLNPRQNSNNGPSGPLVIQTKFAVSRIKRIIQADKNISKLCSVVPVLVAGSLERFMISLCEKADEQARRRSSRRITPSHLKEVVMQGGPFSFLRDVFTQVPNLDEL